MQISISSLKDKALDVDPDLRFMALEDFNRYLNDGSTVVVSKNVESFVPLLFRLLGDNNANVQSQAVRTFPVVIRFVSCDGAVAILKDLYAEAVKENSTTGKEYKQITASIPNMALRSVFNRNKSFSHTIARAVSELILEEIMRNNVNIDSIELLIDILKNIGSALTMLELSNLLDFSRNIAFDYDGIICKRSVEAFELTLKFLCVFVDSGYIWNDAVDKIIAAYERSSKNNKAVNLRLQFFSVLFQRSKWANSHSDYVLRAGSVSQMLLLTFTALKLDKLEVSSDIENYDYDISANENLLREEALITLNCAVSSVPYHLIDDYMNQIFSIVKTLIVYDPLNFENKNESDFSNDSELEFSDEENFIEEEPDENDFSWKVRRQSVYLVRSLALHFTPILESLFEQLVPFVLKAMIDRHTLVSDESINSLIRIIEVVSRKEKASNSNAKRRNSYDMNVEESVTSSLISNITPLICEILFKNLLVEQNSDRFPIFFKLIEELVVSERDLPTEFFDNVYNAITNQHSKIIYSMDYLSLFDAILLQGSLSNIATSFLEYIIRTLNLSIKNKTSHASVMESLNIAAKIFRMLNGYEQIADLFPALNALYEEILQICVTKQFSSELRQSALSRLAIFNRNIEVDRHIVSETINVLNECLGYEAIVRATLESIMYIFDFESKNSTTYLNEEDFVSDVINKCVALLNSNDESLYYPSLNILSIITEKGGDKGSTTTHSNLILRLLISFAQHAEENKYQLLSFKIIGRTLESCQLDTSIVDAIIHMLAVSKFENVEDFDFSSLEFLVRVLAIRTREKPLFDKIFLILKQNLIVRAKILSVIALENSLGEKIEEREYELIAFIEGNSSIPRDAVLFDIHFLGYIASRIALRLINFDNTLLLLKRDDENIRLAASKAIGLYVSKDFGHYLPLLLKEFKENLSVHILILIAIKHALREYKGEGRNDLDQIWDLLFYTVENLDENTATNMVVLRLIADICSCVCLIDNAYTNKVIEQAYGPANDSIIYLIIAILKHLIGELRDQFPSLQELVRITLPFLELPNVDIKQALVGTLLTGIHNKPTLFLPQLQDTILPLVYLEMKPNDKFKKVIPMGPYKYVVDEAVEVRKLVYELLYAICSLDKSVICANAINMEEIGLQIIENGLQDPELDIVVLASINLSHLLRSYSTFLVANPDCLPRLILLLSKNFYRKLKSRASAQEIESHETCVKAVARLTNQVNDLLKSDASINPEWSSFYAELRKNFADIFNKIG